jgi:general secretion pathway protein I
MSRRSRGFTLLEVMVAMTILSGALTWIVVGMARNIAAEGHAKLITSATFLARSKMNDIEDDLYEKGFGEFEKELTGTFEDKGFQRFSWRVVVDKVELPGSDSVQTMMGKMNDVKAAVTGQDTPKPDSTAQNPSPLTSSMGQFGQIYGVVKDSIESAIRRITVQVMWSEGRKTYDDSDVAFYTDPRRVDQAVNTAGLAEMIKKFGK